MKKTHLFFTFKYTISGLDLSRPTMCIVWERIWKTQRIYPLLCSLFRKSPSNLALVASLKIFLHPGLQLLWQCFTESLQTGQRNEELCLTCVMDLRRRKLCQRKRDFVINFKMQRQWQWIVLYSSTNSLLDAFVWTAGGKKSTLNLQTCKPGATAFLWLLPFS